MNKSHLLTFVFGSVLAFTACGPKDGDLVKEIEINNREYQNVEYSPKSESDLCDLLNMDIVQSYFPEAKNVERKNMGISRFGLNNTGCKILWLPSEDIAGKSSGKYQHFMPKGVIELRYNGNPNPETIDDFAEKSLNVRIKPMYDTTGIGSEMDDSYTYVSGVGSIGIWNDGTSSLTFALGENHVFSVSVRYPIAPNKRLELAKKLSQSIIDQVDK